MRSIIVGLLLAAVTTSVQAKDFRLIGFNIERGYKSDAELATVKTIIAGLGYAHVWAFSEVTKGDETQLAVAVGPSFRAILSDQGDDYLSIVYDAAHFDLVATGHVKVTGRSGFQREPLWAKLRSKDSGTELYVLSNHLTRGDGDDPRRTQEAKDLNAWAIEHQPAIALGDFNLDFDVNYDRNDIANSRRQRSNAFNELVRNDVWAWVRPDKLIPTQCDPNYDSVLDFAFVAGAARNWDRESSIENIGCNDNDQNPDHLPIILTIDVP